MKTPALPMVRRLLLLALSAVSTGLATLELHRVLAVKGHTAIEGFWLTLFVLLAFWSSLSFWSAAAGFFALVLRSSRPLGLIWPEGETPLRTRTAVLLPVHNAHVSWPLCTKTNEVLKLKSLAFSRRCMYKFTPPHSTMFIVHCTSRATRASVSCATALICRVVMSCMSVMYMCGQCAL